MTESSLVERWLFLPAHPRDLRQMMTATRFYRELTPRSAVVLASLQPTGAAEQKREYEKVAVDASLRTFRKPLVANRVDGIAPRQISNILRKLFSEFPVFDRVVISDIFYIRSQFVRTILEYFPAEIVLVPEGLGAFRDSKDEEPFRFLSWKNSVRAILGDAIDQGWMRLLRRPWTDHGAGDLVTFWRLCFLILLQPPAPRNDRLDFVNTLLVPRGSALEISVHYRERIEFTFLTVGNQLDPKVGLFVHQPFALEAQVWEAMMRSAKSLGIEKLILKKHQSPAGWADLVDAANRICDGVEIQLVTEGLAEQIAEQFAVGTILAISSSTLLNLAGEGTTPRRIVSYLHLVEKASHDSKSNMDHLRHQKRLLLALGAGQIEFI